MNSINNLEIIRDALNLYIDIVTPYDFDSMEAYDKKISEVKETLKEVENDIEYKKRLKLSIEEQIKLYGLPF